MSATRWIAVDWGTSTLRVWVFDDAEQLIAERSCGKGMGGLSPHEFEPSLLELIAPYLKDVPIPVICCGMVGARQGWAEAPYAQVPCTAPDAHRALRIAANDPRIEVYVLPGLSQKKPADVMRGEETQIAGYLAQNPDFFGTLCLPGTHTKWVQISAREIVSFRTFMTGELFALLGTYSVLRHGVVTDHEPQNWSEDDYLLAVGDAISSPAQLGSRLFGLRAEALLHGLSPQAARSRLSGYLIGLELCGAKHYWLGQELALIGSPGLSGLYARALKAQGVTSEAQAGDDMVLAGLKAAYDVLHKGLT